MLSPFVQIVIGVASVVTIGTCIILYLVRDSAKELKEKYRNSNDISRRLEERIENEVSNAVQVIMLELTELGIIKQQKSAMKELIVEKIMSKIMVSENENGIADIVDGYIISNHTFSNSFDQPTWKVMKNILK